MPPLEFTRGSLLIRLQHLILALTASLFAMLGGCGLAPASAPATAAAPASVTFAPAATVVPATAVPRAGCQDIPYVDFAVDGAPRMTIELARTDAERARGLMGRESMPENHGMLFVYLNPSRARFWMKDTLIPLSIAFISSERTIIAIEDMEAQSLDTHGAPSPYLYALEANQGWFARYRVEVGQRVEICFGDGQPTSESGGRRAAIGGLR